MTVEKLTPEELHILQHALGLDQYGQGTWYRNHYVTSDGPSPARDRLKRMESLGLVWCYSLALLRADDTGWSVTELGKQVVREQSPPPPKLTRSQQRYRAWLQVDCGLSFGQWLKEKL